MIGTTVLRDADRACRRMERRERHRRAGALPGGARPAPRRAHRGSTTCEPGDALRRPGEDAVAAATRLVRGLDCSCLPIQGPPGTGKTFTSAHAIVDLIVRWQASGHHRQQPRRHHEPSRRGDARGGDAQGRHHGDADASTVRAAPIPIVTAVNDSKIVESALAAGEVQLVAGTAWLFARPGMEESLDHLFVDEAGQMSLANVVAVGTAARNLVLVGDPQQLSQPSKGTHPAGAGVARSNTSSTVRTPCRRSEVSSSSRRTGCTRTISAFVSELSYEDRLVSVGPMPSAARRGRGRARRARTALAPRRARGQQAVVRRGGRGGRSLLRVAPRAPLDRRQRRRAADHDRRRPRRRPVQRPGARDRSRCCRTAPESAPSTSSRVRRRRSRSCRWRRRAPPMCHEVWSSCSARTASTSPSHGRGRWRSSSPARPC